MGIHQCTAVVLLLLCASLSTYGQPAEIRRRYEHFLTQHVYGGITEQTCDRVMRQRRITRFPTGNDCKEVNTFIQANGNHVRTVCTGGGTRQTDNRDLYMSNNQFTVITCTLRSGERHPNCRYRGKESSRKIVVACEGEWPTHYEKGVIV
uniref:Ribonuclease-like 3 n=1 Tax=Danio rerio TaxID=7955 RepID=RNSL3_DANRE|nr:RecName: Full=Ribonuclease-like 3; Short=RNase ZF-3; Short=RNase-like 3; Short=ZF-RNase-3; AltName: Full=Dr-RNase 1; Contains: RecName: Full=N-terminal peptide; Contains: RecName: Full=LF-ZF3; Flags: Precursor [Danio rerio]